MQQYIFKILGWEEVRQARVSLIIESEIKAGAKEEDIASKREEIEQKVMDLVFMPVRTANIIL